jgi:hypothetical protein
MFGDSCFVGVGRVDVFESLMKALDGYCEGEDAVGRWWCGNGAVDVRSSVGNCCFVGSVKVFGSLVKNFSEGLEL